MRCARRVVRNHRPGLTATGKVIPWAVPLLLALAMPVPPAMAQGSVQVPAPGPAAGIAPPVAPEPVISFTQRNVPAEATAADAVQAKEQAFAAGRRAAWQALAASAGVPAPNLSDAQIENLVSSIIVEQERVTPTRYTGRLTVNFSPDRVRSVLGQAVAGPAPPSAAPAGSPPSLWLDATATYGSLGEWLELRRRLASPGGPVSAVEVRAISVDAARLRLGLRQPPAEAAPVLTGLGVALQPTAGAMGENWRVGLAGGG
jgi:hypothetical protein